jgi:short subunit dehydrogenase-like uncharacterized protein
MTDRTHDIVLHGATGYVGKLTARHLAEQAGDTRIALSGRSRERLEALRDELRVDWPLLVTDAHDTAAVTALAASAKVVATTVGPYRRYGRELVRACAAAGTSYCDLTGETLFVRETATELHEQARETGARIVHSAGFDSIPPDLGVLLLHRQVHADGAGTLGQTVGVLASARGGVSGGTVDSMRSELEAVEADPSLRRVLGDPYALSPDRGAEPDGRDERDPMRPVRDPLLDRWVAPSPFGPHDSRIVRRSNALLGHAYGDGFRYREHLGVGTGVEAPVLAGLVAAGLGALLAGMQWGPTRSLLGRVLPDPGQGPSDRSRAAGHFRFDTYTETSTGDRYVSTVADRRDPGYGGTAVMFGETALSLATDPLESAAGVLTPAAAVGEHLIRRLRGAGLDLTATRR